MSMLKSGLAFAAGFLLAVVIVVFLFKGGGTDNAAGSPPRASRSAAMEVPVTPVVKKTVPVYLEYVGTADAICTVTLQALVTGYLLKRAVSDGSDVDKGELLYQIDPRIIKQRPTRRRLRRKRIPQRSNTPRPVTTAMRS